MKKKKKKKQINSRLFFSLLSKRISNFNNLKWSKWTMNISFNISISKTFSLATQLQMLTQVVLVARQCVCDFAINHFKCLRPIVIIKVILKRISKEKSSTRTLVVVRRNMAIVASTNHHHHCSVNWFLPAVQGWWLNDEVPESQCRSFHKQIFHCHWLKESNGVSQARDSLPPLPAASKHPYKCCGYL